MIDDETRKRAQEYVDGFAEATADDPKMPKPDPEPMEAAVTEEAKGRSSWEDQNAADTKLFSEAFNAPEAKPEAPEAKPATPDAKPETFAQAWKKARAAGVKTFDWAGKPGVKFSTENKAEAAARKALKAKPAAVSAASQMPAPMSDKAKPAEKPAVYDGVFPANVVAKVKEKLDDDGQVGKAKLHANGRPNLTAR